MMSYNLHLCNMEIDRVVENFLEEFSTSKWLKSIPKFVSVLVYLLYEFQQLFVIHSSSVCFVVYLQLLLIVIIMLKRAIFILNVLNHMSCILMVSSVHFTTHVTFYLKDETNYGLLSLLLQYVL